MIIIRLNLYAEELTDEVALVTKTAANTGITHYGVRFFLKSPDALHNTELDDDRSAVTFWIPETKSFPPEDLAHALRVAARHVDHAIGMIADRKQQALTDA